MNSLAGVIERIRPALPFAAGLLALLLILLLASMVRLFRQSRRPAPPHEAEPDTPPGRSASIGVMRQASAHLERLTSLAEGAFGVPWVALIGTPGAALDGALPERLAVPPDLPALRRLLRDGACQIAFCRDGVLINCEPSLLDRGRWLDRWRATLRAARICRPERPLDALVLAVAAAELRELDATALIARGEQFYQLLAAVQRDTGWRVPVTLLVTGCEALSGFETLATTLPDAARHAPLGWACPYALDTAFEPAWAREAIAAVVERLALAHLTVAADTQGPERAADLLGLIDAVAALEAPLATLLTSAIRGSAYHEGFMFRGVFLAGSAGAFGPPVLTAKVFREHRLARPALGEATRRHRRRRWAQAGFAAVALLCGVGALHLDEVWRRHFGGVLALLRQIAPHEEAPPAAVADAEAGLPPEMAARALAVIQAMGELTTNSIETWAAPASALTGADARVSDAIARGWEAFVLSAFARALDDGPTVARRLDVGPSAGADADLDALAGRIIAYDDMVARYRMIGRGTGVEGIDALAGYAFNVVLPIGFREDYDLYIDALATVRRPRIDLIRARGMVRLAFDQVARGAYAQGRLSVATAEVADRLDRLARTRDPDEARPLLADLSTSLDRLSTLMDGADSAWALRPGETPAIAGALARLSTAARGDGVLTPDFVASLHESARAGLDAARRDLLATAMPDGTPILTVHDGRLALAPVLAAAREPLATLVARPFMAPMKAAAFPAQAAAPGRRIEWALAPLESAQAMAESYLAVVPAALRALPDEVQPAVEAVAAAQLGLHVDALARQARRPGGDLSADDTAMQAEIANFAAASPMLASLRDSLRSAGMAKSAAWIDAAVTTQAARLLGEVDSRLAAAAPYQLADPTLAFWTGSGPMAAPAFGASSIAELVSTLPPRHDFIERLARDQAAALVAWLRDSTSAGDGAAAAMAQRWQAIIDTFDRYHRGDPANALSLLEQFMSADMDRIANAGCAELPPAPVFGASNYFATQLQTLRYAVAMRCRLVTREVAIDRYRALARDFQADLAGRLPFSWPDSPGGAASLPDTLPQADPNDVRRLFQAYGADLQSLRDQLPMEPGFTAPRRFVTQLMSVQDSLAPLLLDSSPRAALAYDVSPAFYAEAAWSPGIDQLIDMDLAIGERHVSSREPPGTLPWVAGQPVDVTLRWAANGPSVPAQAPAGRADDAATARFHAEGPWALLDLLRRHAPSPAELAALGDHDSDIAVFEVRLRPNPAALGHGEAMGRARIFLRLGLTGIARVAGQPDRRMPVSLADFPAEAPPLPDGNLPQPMMGPPAAKPLAPMRPGPTRQAPPASAPLASAPLATMGARLSAGNEGMSDAP